MIDATRTVRELATEIPAATRIFESIGLDYCCGGAESLHNACARAGLSPEDVARRLEDVSLASAPASDNWQTRRLAELIYHIVKTHHEFTRSELERLAALTNKVVGVHRANHPELLRIQELLTALTGDLNPHMLKEEQVLFPYVERIEQALIDKTRPPQPFFGTVRNPVRMMTIEHDSAGEVLKEIRRISNGFTAPADACISFKTLYQALEALEQDLHQHIHLENNILFPRAVEIEDSF